MAVQRIPVPPSALGESPFWHPLERRLYWCDIQGLRIHSWDPASGLHRSWATPSEPGCCAPTDQGRIVVGLRDGFGLLDTATGHTAMIALLEHDPRQFRLNDGRCDRAGRLWAGSLFSPKTGPDAALWCLRADGSGGYAVQRMAGDCTTANGLAFSPDDRSMYWADTPAHRIDRFAFDLDSGTLGTRSLWKAFAPRTDGRLYGGRPDGASVDARGNYWVAMYEGGCVLQLSPEGEVLQRLDTPVHCPTMVCFGGEDLRTLYITSAGHGRPEQEHAAEVPAGALMQCRVDVPGLPVNFFRQAAARQPR
ncbi:MULTISPECIES: SMP-30/gluconolactonase/LRE family protein [Delftia]|uniref:SMP-30/gluconolactonase/LRE family protein n=2 Tax=Delftia TaxID=80865 RepID=A0A7T2S2G0_DELAC|nr:MULTISPECIES: SMP-30/gluconolactonase/LRE family protein [Delftia]MBB1650431.1 gluconolaconase [Delftia sp. UME58]QPS07622.1 SMP-30/gluconolactonase/LRE family protein [Delftia acidovorans]